MTATHETNPRLERRRWRGLPPALPAGIALCIAGAVAWVGLGRRAPQTASAGLVSSMPQAGSREGTSIDGNEASSNAFAIPSARAASHPPPPFSLPALQPRLLNPPALTVDVETRHVGRRGERPARKTVTRTAERVHVSLGANGVEWLFVRNPADPRRMSGTMLDHARKSVVEYDESEMRNGGLGRGWADVVALGVEPEALGELVSTGKRQVLSGIEFAQRARPTESHARVKELWWSDEAALPLRVVVDDGPTATEVVVRAVRREVDPLLLRDMHDRYPGYAVIDIADYREAHHDDSHQQ